MPGAGSTASGKATGSVIDKLTEAQLDEFREAFNSFDKVSRVSEESAGPFLAPTHRDGVEAKSRLEQDPCEQQQSLYCTLSPRSLCSSLCNAGRRRQH